MDSERKTCRVSANLHPKCQEGHYQEQVFFFQTKKILLTFFWNRAEVYFDVGEKSYFFFTLREIFFRVDNLGLYRSRWLFWRTFFSEYIPISLTFLDSEWRIWTSLDSERKICSLLAKFLLQVCRDSILCLRTNSFRKTCSKKYFFLKFRNSRELFF